MVRGLLLDLEGVLYEGDKPVPGAVAALETLRQSGLGLRYLTNTTTRPRRAIAERLARMGFALDPAHLFTPPAAAALLLRRLGVQRILLAAPETLAEDFADFEVVTSDTGHVEAVVLGDLYLDFTWVRLNGLFQVLARGLPLVALHKNRVCQREEGLSLDLGPFVAALEYAADTEAQVVGKPAKAFFDLALQSLGLPADQVLMVGDDIEADVGGAQAAGLSAVQVRTGKYRPRDERHPRVTAEGRIASLAELPRWLAEQG